MKITVANGAGFCFGVRRAYSILEKSLDERIAGERIFTLGSFVHTPLITEELASKGVYITDEESLEKLFSEADANAPVTVLLRTHGVSRQIKEKLEDYSRRNSDFRFVDCTCPCVLKIHDIVKRETATGAEDTLLLVYGDREHPEVDAILSYSSCPYEVFKTVDVLLTPCAPTPAFKIGELQDPLTMYLNDLFTIPSALAGVSAASVPAGFAGAEKLPVGVQFICGAFEEARLLKICKAFEEISK